MNVCRQKTKMMICPYYSLSYFLLIRNNYKRFIKFNSISATKKILRFCRRILIKSRKANAYFFCFANALLLCLACKSNAIGDATKSDE